MEPIWGDGAGCSSWIVSPRAASTPRPSICRFTGYEDDVRCVRDAVQAARRHGAVHIVSHSYAGLPVCAGGHLATHLTFVASRMPLPGESPAAHTPEWGFADFQRCMTTDDEGVTTVSRDVRPYFFHRCPPALADFALDRLRPMRSAVPHQPLADPAWRRVPSSYVVCTDDRAVQPSAQRDHAARWVPRSSSTPTTARSSATRPCWRASSPRSTTRRWRHETGARRPPLRADEGIGNRQPRRAATTRP